MKQNKRHILAHLTCFGVLLATLLLSPSKAIASDFGDVNNNTPFEADSVHISLLTCGPHPAIYALYGHTALRYEDRSKGIDLAINYGAFSFDTHFFALKFMFGLTDYEMGIMSFDEFCFQYNYYGSSVVQQEFNLTAAEKLKVAKALDENAKPENVVYRYNYYYDNCTTRARDIVINNLDGKVVFPTEVPEGLTYRKMIHGMNEDHPWARLGNDLLLGVGSDRDVDAHDMQFLPHYMFDAAEKAYIVDKQGNKRPLILEETQILEQRVEPIKKEFPLSPVECGMIFAILTLILSIIEVWKKKYFWWYDALVFVVQAACGLILTAMIFSQHPTVKVNIQLLIFFPLVIFFGYKAIRSEMARHKQNYASPMHWYWYAGLGAQAVALVLMGCGVQWIDVSVLLFSLSVGCRHANKLKIKPTKK